MGLFQVRVRLANPSSRERSFEDDFWVDTGALYSFVPRDRLEAIGLQPTGKRRLVLADGRTETMEIGEASFHIPQLGETLTCPVIFAPPGSLLLLGATALENFGVGADPETKALKPILAIIGGFLGSR
jgi:clan AA aspartic protease